MTQFLNWLSKSSANPEELSLTVRGFLLSNIASIIMVLQVFGLNWTEDYVTTIIQASFAVVGAIISLIGLSRKLYFTVKGK